MRLGADVIVNTDADNQYNADDIPALVYPILQRHAEIVIGERPISTIDHFSPIKKMFSNGSRVVRVVSIKEINDAPNGFVQSAERLLKKSSFLMTIPIHWKPSFRLGKKIYQLYQYPFKSMKTYVHLAW